MARENEVKLIGYVEEIEKDIDNKVAQLKMRVMRRNGRIDYPTILVFSQHYDMLKDICVGNMVMVKGFFATMNVKQSIKCEECGALIEDNSTISSVIGIFIIKLEGTYSLEDFKEVSNCINLLGPLCRNVKLKELRTGIKNAQYQMAISRKIRVEGQDSVTTDFPFISSLDTQAEEDYRRMEEGSQCWINGGIQTRDIIKNHQCQCGNTINVKQPIMEVCPYNVEYLHNCKFE